MHNEDVPLKVIYKFNGGRGAVLCRKCRVILDCNISWDEADLKWEGKDLCDECKLTTKDTK